MSMNVGAIMKALMGDSQPADARALELRIGQIVRGVLLQVMDGGDALLQVGGVQVRAQLAADLPVGRSTLLQVQPTSTGSQIVLKPLADSRETLEGDGLQDAVRSFGLPNQKWSFELLQGLKRDGYPIDRETANWFRQAADAKPTGADAQEWMNAAGVAFRRGLAPTETTIASLRQALYGPPVHEQLEGLQKLLGDYLGQPGSAAAAPQGAWTGAAAAAARVSQLLAQGSALLAEGSDALLAASGDAAPQAASGEAHAAEAAGARPQGAGGAGVAAAAAQDADGSAAAGGALVSAGAERAAVAGGQTAAGQASAASGGHTAESAARVAGQALPLAGDAAASADAAAAKRPLESAVASASDRSGDAPAETPSAAATASRLSAAGAEAPRTEASWIGRFLQWLGVEHEHQAAALPAADGGMRQDGMPNAGDDGGHGAARAAGDSLKSALLTLASSEVVPPQLREAAQSMAQQITGQQLLLSSDKTNQAPMSQITLFVPMKGQDGDTTATIHVQTRKGRRGEWDTSNCRLLFDLRMSHLGDTVVDVQVADKVVSLKLMNDRSWVAEMIDSARDDAAAGLRAAGYQLLSLKTVPFPVPVQAESAEGHAAQPSGMRVAAEAYAAKPYKGVDYRA